MKTKVESIQPGRKLEGKRMFLILGAVVAAMMLATPAPAEANAVSDPMWASVNQLIQAAVAAGGGDATSAVSALNTAESLLSQAKAALSSSGLSLDPVAFGKKIDAANKKLVDLESYLEGSKWSGKSAVSKLASAAKSLQKLANLAGSPLLEEVDARSAGFHKAGELVLMAFAIPEGCPETNWSAYYTETVPGVVADFSVDKATGEILVTLGSTRGGADVVVTGCGLPAWGVSKELYNYGAKTVAGLPDGFPTNLTNGDYGLTYSANVSCSDGSSYSIPATSLGSFPLSGNLKSFYNAFKSVMDAAVASVSVPGCTQGVVYSAFNGHYFTCTVTVSCTSCSEGTCATCTASVVFTFTKL